MKTFQETLNAQLETRDWLVGDRPSFADITAFVTCDFARVITRRVEQTQPHLLACYEGFQTRPSASL